MGATGPEFLGRTSGITFVKQGGGGGDAGNPGVSHLEHITLFRCSIGGNPQARLAKGAVLRTLIESQDPTLILLTETKRKRKDIPKLPNYSLLSLDPLELQFNTLDCSTSPSLCFKRSLYLWSVCSYCQQSRQEEGVFLE